MSDTESSTPATTPPCPLLKCPSEIRNRIWSLVVKVETVVTRCNSPRETFGKHHPPIKLALAFTCRQIYREVTPIYYSKNMFHFSYGSIELPRQFAAAIGPANAESITAVGIDINATIMDISHQKLQELLPFPNLKTLVYFEVPEIYGYHPNELRLPRPSSTVAVLWKSRTYRQINELYS